jgi:hypothetical protein
MKIQFKHKEYQEAAVEDVVDCFAGQPKVEGVTYRLDPGKLGAAKGQSELDYGTEAFRNAPIALDKAQLLENIQKVRRRRNLPQSKALVATKNRDRFSTQVDTEAGIDDLETLTPQGSLGDRNCPEMLSGSQPVHPTLWSAHPDAGEALAGVWGTGWEGENHTGWRIDHIAGLCLDRPRAREGGGGFHHEVEI